MMKVQRFILLVSLVMFLNSFYLVYADDYQLVWNSGTAINNSLLDVAVGDLDNDGKSEIIVADHPNSGGAKIYVFENTNNDSYQQVWNSGTILTMRKCHIDVGDQDGDGKLEIVAAESRTEPPFNGKIHVFENSGDNSYQEVWNSGSALNGIEHSALFLGDADYDGKQEIIIGTGYQCNDHKIRIYENIGDNAYQEVWNSGNLLSDTVTEGSVGDTDNDGKNEIIVGSGGLACEVYVFESNGNNSFNLVSTISGFGKRPQPAIGDQDRDNQAEIIVGDRNGVVHIFEHVSNNNYTNVWNSGTICSNVCLTTTGDQDYDGNREIIVPCAGSKIYLFENTGDDIYNEVWNSGTVMSQHILRVAAGDQDGDGKGEIIAPCYDGKVYVFENKPAKITVNFDIKPQSCPNPLNIASKGVLPVAILGTENLNVTSIDPSSVQLEDVSAIRWNIEDVSTPVFDKQGDCDCTTEGSDGYNDLTLKFKTQEIVATFNNIQDGDTLTLKITGQLLDGTHIDGEDWIIVKSKKNNCKTQQSIGKAVKLNSPEKYTLHNNYPNPFNPSTTIEYQLPMSSRVRLTVYDVMGREIATLVNGVQEPGIYSVIWNTVSSTGKMMPSGVYILKLNAGSFTETRKMILMR